MTRTVVLFTTIGAMTLGCSSQAFTSASGDAAVNVGGSNTGSSMSTGGASGSSGKLGAGGSRSSGGANGTGARPLGGSPGSGGNTTTGGGSSTDSGVIDGNVVNPDSGVTDAGSGIRCTGADPSFPTFDKGCTDDASCALVRHTTSCCGDQLFMGINHAEVARFQAAEAICDEQYPGCGCASMGADAEDGTMVPWGSENLITVACDNGTCRTRYSGQTFPCGTSICTDQQYCSMYSGGPAGSPTTYSCNFLGGCTSCSCIGGTQFCTCTEDQGIIKVSCAAP